jgi:hypothetical protein
MPGKPVHGLIVENGRHTIQAEILAERFGLTPEQLRAEMRAGRLTSLVERGVGEDAGRFRLTFRRSTQVWSIQVESDGSAHETDPPAQEPALFRMVEAARLKPER